MVNEPSLGLNFWSMIDIPDEWLELDQKDYPKLNIRKILVSNILNMDDIKYSYIMMILLAKINDDIEILKNNNFSF